MIIQSGGSSISPVTFRLFGPGSALAGACCCPASAGLHVTAGGRGGDRILSAGDGDGPFAVERRLADPPAESVEDQQYRRSARGARSTTPAGRSTLKHGLARHQVRSCPAEAGAASPGTSRPDPPPDNLGRSGVHQVRLGNWTRDPGPAEPTTDGAGLLGGRTARQAAPVSRPWPRPRSSRCPSPRAPLLARANSRRFRSQSSRPGHRG